MATGERALEAWRAWLNRNAVRSLVGQGWATEVGAVVVVLEALPESATGVGLRVAVQLPERLATVSIVSAAHALTKKQRLYTGDAELDDAVVIHIPETSLYGSFDAPTRATIAALVARGMYASGGALRLEPWATEAVPAEAVDGTMASLVALAGRLSLSADEARLGIAAIMDGDPKPAVRETYTKLFGAAPDVRDARARRAASASASDGTARFELLAAHAVDASLGLDVRLEAFTTLIAERAPSEIEPLLANVPGKLVDSLITALLARLAAATESAERQACARLVARLVDAKGSLSLRRAWEIAKALAPAGEPTCLPFFVQCLGRNNDDLLSLAVGGLLALRMPAEQVMSTLDDHKIAVAARAAPRVAQGQPALVGRLYLALMREVAGDDELVTQCLSTVALANRQLRGEGKLHALHGEHQQAARALLGSDVSAVQTAAIEVLGEVGDVKDIAILEPATVGLFRSSRMKDAARAAIATIKERLGVRDEHGALSIADDTDDGALAVVDDE